jgi:hypothetical protein
MDPPDIDWLCARYPSLSEAIVTAVCSEYDTEQEAVRQLSSINPGVHFDYNENDDNDENEIVGAAEVDEIELVPPDEDITDFEKRLTSLIMSHETKNTKPVPKGPARMNYNYSKSPKKQNAQLSQKKQNAQLSQKKQNAQLSQKKQNAQLSPRNFYNQPAVPTSPQKSYVALSTRNNFSKEISDISELLGLPFEKVERVYHWKQIKACPQRTILELIITAKTHPPTAADMVVIENTNIVFQTIPWPVVVRLCLFVQGNGEKAFQVAEKIADFEAWDSLIIPEVEGIEQPAIESPDAEEPQPTEFTRVGDKASTEKVKASMSLSQQSQQYNDLQQLAKTNLLNTTDPALRHEFQKTYNELKDKNHTVKQRIAKLTEPRNETPWYTDLHGLYVPEAMQVAKVKVNSWWEVEKDKAVKDIRPLTLNTGLGSHSPGGFSKIKVALSKWLTIDGWIHEVHKGHIQVVRR